MDVTGVNEGPEVAVVVLAEVYGGVKGVRVAVGEHPGEALVLQDALHLGDLVLDGLGAEKTLFWSRTLRLVILTLCQRAAEHKNGRSQK